MVLVTGATGILGRVIVLQLLQRGMKVRATKRPGSILSEVQASWRFYTENYAELFAKIEWVDVDFTDVNSLQAALEGVSQVYHCAAAVGFDPRDDRKIFDTNIKGTQNLLYAVESSSVEKFLFVSSISVLDEPNEKGELDEDSAYNPKLDHAAYPISKHFAEMEVWRASAEGLKVIVVVPGMIIGSGNWGQSSGSIFSTYEKKKLMFPGTGSFVDVRDVARASIELMEGNHFGERFILISQNLPYLQVGNMVRRKLGLKPAAKIPEKPLHMLVKISPFLSWLVPPLRLATPYNINAMTGINRISNNKIRETLKFNFIPVDQSIDFHVNNYIADHNSRKKINQ